EEQLAAVPVAVERQRSHALHVSTKRLERRRRDLLQRRGRANLPQRLAGSLAQTTCQVVDDGQDVALAVGGFAQRDRRLTRRRLHEPHRNRETATDRDRKSTRLN